MYDIVLKNAEVCGGDFKLARNDLAVSGGVIAKTAPGLSGKKEYDLSGCTVLPGFVDVHIHGCVGADACDADREGLNKISAHLAKRGVTSFCPTTMTLPKDELKHILAVVKNFMDSSAPGAAARGVNLEGPYIALSKKGAQKGDYVRHPDFAEFKELFDSCGGIIKLVDIAPEQECGDDFIRNAKELCTVSIAHTDADYDQAARAFRLGITHATHLYNAMSGVSHRAPGVVGAVLDDENVKAELICDGFHIHPAVLRTTFRALGQDRSVIVSDSMRAAGLPDGEYELGGQPVFVKNGQARLADGTIAGSTTDMLQEVKNLLSWGVPFEQVIRSATINPAREIHEDHRIGSIEEGKLADLAVLDQDWNPVLVLAGGKVVYELK